MDRLIDESMRKLAYHHYLHIALFSGAMAIIALFASCTHDDLVDITGSIMGTVYDNDNTPIQGVAMTLTPLGKTTTTSQNGGYSFEDIDAGSYRVQARKSGFREDTKTVNVIVGDKAQLDFHLEILEPQLTVNQETFDFGNESTTLSLDIRNTGDSPLTWQVSEDISWLSCIPTSGTTAAGASSSVILNADRSGLSRGNYSQTVAITSNGGSKVITVNISVQGLTVSAQPEMLDFGSTTTSLSLTLTNTGTQSVSYTLTPSNSWIIPSKTSGLFTYGSDVITVSANRTGLNSGDYEGSLALVIGQESITIPVRMNVPSKEKPTVSLNAVEDVTYNSVRLRGGIVSIGSQKVSSHGFCWGLTELPEVGGTSCNLGDSEQPKNFEYNASGLQPGTKYYVRAYAVNAEGTSYSNQMTFTTREQPTPPVVETGTVSSIGSSQATISGNLIKTGDDAGVTEYGHVWSTTANPTIAHNKTTHGATTTLGSYTSTLTGLSPTTTYHVRAYATNLHGTTYGDDVTFQTTAGQVVLQTNGVTKITHNAATGGGTISRLEGNTIAERGICWATTANPTLSANHVTSAETSNSFNVRMTGLATQTTYHTRAYVKTGTGDVFFGNDVSFQTTHEIVMPSVGATQVTDIGVSKATFGSSITSNGRGTISDAGFCYSLNGNPTTSDTRVSYGSATGSFGKTVTGLQENTTYHVRAYATNEAGTAYGTDATFTTLEVIAPSLSSVTVSGISNTSATFEATVTTTGNGTISDAGFVYSTNHYPTTSDSKLSCGKTTALKSRPSGLTQETTYYVRAYATNEKGTSYSNEQTFKTAKTEVNPYTTLTVETSYGSTTLDMAKVNGGTFMMGAQNKYSSQDNYDTNAYDDERPVHQVTISSFYLSKTLVTQYLWYVVMGSYPGVSNSYGLGDDYPVYNITYSQAVQFATKLGSITGHNFRLPTEAEWEFAARGGSASNGTKYSGSATVGTVAWYSQNAGGKTHPVAQKQPNELNLYDMNGNLWEWCSDMYGNYSSSTQTNPTGPASGSNRVIRGGGYNDSAIDCRVSVRSSATANQTFTTVGLRLVMTE